MFIKSFQIMSTETIPDLLHYGISCKDLSLFISLGADILAYKT